MREGFFRAPIFRRWLEGRFRFADAVHQLIEFGILFVVQFANRIGESARGRRNFRQASCGKFHRYGFLFAIAIKDDRNFVARAIVLQEFGQGAKTGDLLFAHFDNDIVFLQAGFLRT